MGESDTPLIDHLVMREFVSGPPSYRFIYERVRDRKPSLRKGSWAVCRFRTEFFEKRRFVLFLSSECLKRTHRLLIKHQMHMLRVYGHRRWRRCPRQVWAYVKGVSYLGIHMKIHFPIRTWGASDIVKAKSSGEDPRATGGLVSNLPHPQVNKIKQHEIVGRFDFEWFWV